MRIQCRHILKRLYHYEEVIKDRAITRGSMEYWNMERIVLFFNERDF